MNPHQYFVYILTNSAKTVLYIGVCNNLPQRIIEHYKNRGSKKSFTGKYHCYYLIYFERTQYIDIAIKREKQIKGWTRKRKVELINISNPHWEFLNNEVMEWPPSEDAVSRGDIQ
jgi:putative endonuclease